MSTLSEAVPTTTTRKLAGPVLDVILRYHDGYLAVNMKEVSAISWRKAEVKAKPAEQGGDPEIPGTVIGTAIHGPHVPEFEEIETIQTVAADDNRTNEVCYWTGTKWVCGPRCESEI